MRLSLPLNSLKILLALHKTKNSIRIKNIMQNLYLSILTQDSEIRKLNIKLRLIFKFCLKLLDDRQEEQAKNIHTS